MAHHKRKRPKNRRAGCLMCKPHKQNGVKKRGNVGRGSLIEYARSWKQEKRGWLKEKEGRAEAGQ